MDIEKELLDTLEQANLVIPPEVVSYWMERKGSTSPDPRCAKLVAIAVQKYLTEILQEVQEVLPSRPATVLASKGKDQKMHLALHDLSGALEAQGVKIEKPMFYADKTIGGI